MNRQIQAQTTNVHSTSLTTALEDTRYALRIRAERAEADLDTACADNRRLDEKLAEAAFSDTEETPAGTTSPRPGRSKKTTATRIPNSET